VKDVRYRGKTVFLTTHFMEEAERLCDRVAIMDEGKIVALDTPENLIDALGIEERIVFKVNGDFPINILSDLPRITRIESIQDEIVIYGKANGSKDHPPLVTDIVTILAAEGVRFVDLQTEQPNLEDVFLTLTGRQMRS
jgi:ABC-2 type transport system ATP-binding protein